MQVSNVLITIIVIDVEMNYLPTSNVIEGSRFNLFNFFNFKLEVALDVEERCKTLSTKYSIQ